MATTPTGNARNNLLELLGRVPPRVLAPGVALLAVALIAAAVLEPLIIGGLFAVVPILVLGGIVVWRRPEFGLLLIILVNADFYSLAPINNRLPFGLDARDLLVLTMLGVTFGREFLARGWKTELPWWPVAAPMLILMTVSVSSVFYALTIRNVEMNWAFNEFRPFLNYMTFFVTALCIKTHAQLRVVLIGLFVIVNIQAVAIIGQQFLGRSAYIFPNLGNNRSTWEVWDQSAGGFGSLRIIPPQHVLMVVISMIALVLALYPRQTPRLRRFFLFQFVFLNLAMVLTYTRAQWLTSMLAMLLIAMVLPFADKKRLFAYGLAVILFGTPVAIGLGSVLQFGNLEFTAPIVERFTSIFAADDTLNSDSLQWRVFENEQALASIRQYPVFGVGLGSEYREPTIDRGEVRYSQYRLLRFIHNTYLYVTVKMGVIGLAAIGSLFVAFQINGWRAYRRAPDNDLKRMIAAILACALALLFWSITQPHPMQADTGIVIGVSIGLVGAMHGLLTKSVAGDNIFHNPDATAEEA